ncbi:MAG: PilZ domain-containing protein [Desulfobacterales bacterium]|nr:MAG: PilZ domain-containing protein [Desulfobacterales bacterium]UCD89287.1 MAG: PilZ domain-containing protein [Desulfobacterales bacterium]
MVNQSYQGSERRIYFRITYRIENRAKLRVGEDEFEVADISQGGVRLVNTKGIALGGKISGTAMFLCGESMEIEGEIVWEKNGEFGALLKHLIPAATLENEKKHVILKHLA